MIYPEPQDDSDDYVYRVESVEKTDPPAGLPGDDWYRYIIGRGNSKIEGMKPGSLSAVRQHAENVADNLNERANKSISTYASRNRK